MATATSVERTVGMADRRFLLPNIGWDRYEALLQLFGDQRSIQLAYDRGSMELMSSSPKHELYAYLIGRMVEDLAFELNIPIKGTRSTTFRSRSAERGIEADESYYLFDHVDCILRTGNLDVDAIPPPDLAIEVEITNSMLDRLGIYASLGVPELWRYDGERLRVLLLQKDGAYVESPTSLAFPLLPLDVFASFVEQKDDGDDNPWIASFRAWVREVLLPPYRAHRNPEG